MVRQPTPRRETERFLLQRLRGRIETHAEPFTERTWQAHPPGPVLQGATSHSTSLGKVIFDSKLKWQPKTGKQINLAGLIFATKLQFHCEADTNPQIEKSSEEEYCLTLYKPSLCT